MEAFMVFVAGLQDKPPMEPIQFENCRCHGPSDDLSEDMCLTGTTWQPCIE
jgi:hypothetical protein